MESSTKKHPPSPDLFLLSSHPLNPRQEAEAQENLKLGEIHALPPALQARWSQLPPNIMNLSAYAQPIWAWLIERSKAGDWVLVQGEQGLVYHSVLFCKNWGLIPIYAASKREIEEEAVQNDGSIQIRRKFRHISFRKYESSSLPLNLKSNEKPGNIP